jgi:hypothetical protein
VVRAELDFGELQLIPQSCKSAVNVAGGKLHKFGSSRREGRDRKWGGLLQIRVCR